MFAGPLIFKFLILPVSLTFNLLAVIEPSAFILIFPSFKSPFTINPPFRLAGPLIFKFLILPVSLTSNLLDLIDPSAFILIFPSLKSPLTINPPFRLVLPVIFAVPVTFKSLRLPRLRRSTNSPFIIDILSLIVLILG